MTQRILFYAPTRIGDAVLASALLRHIAARSPQARVTIVASPFSAPLYAHYPLLDELNIFKKQRFAAHWLSLLRVGWRHAWSDVWDMYGSAISLFLPTFRRHIFPGGSDALPKAKQFEQRFKIAELPLPQLWSSEADRDRGAQLLPGGKSYLILGPCANWGPKEWPMAFYMALGQALFAGPYQGWRPVIVCAPHERERALPLLESLAPFQPVDLTTGQQDLLTIYACMERAQGYIGNDSGLMHMAAAAGIPTLGLFGPTNATVYQPWGACTRALVAPHGDLRSLNPHVVMSAFLDLSAQAQAA